LFFYYDVVPNLPFYSEPLKSFGISGGSIDITLCHSGTRPRPQRGQGTLKSYRITLLVCYNYNTTTATGTIIWELSLLWIMNWKPSILKTAISLFLGIVAGLLYMTSYDVSPQPDTLLVAFILAAIVIFILVYVIYSLIQK